MTPAIQLIVQFDDNVWRCTSIQNLPIVIKSGNNDRFKPITKMNSRFKPLTWHLFLTPTTDQMIKHWPIKNRTIPEKFSLSALLNSLWLSRAHITYLPSLAQTATSISGLSCHELQAKISQHPRHHWPTINNRNC